MNFIKALPLKRFSWLMILLLAFTNGHTQKVESISFHLYTDSLKKGFYNYINVDGMLSDGNWQPLDSTQVQFSSTAGHFRGNDLFIDSSVKEDHVKVKAVLRKNPSVWKETVIYIRKRGFTEPLKTNYEIIDEMRQRSSRRPRQHSS